LQITAAVRMRGCFMVDLSTKLMKRESANFSRYTTQCLRALVACTTYGELRMFLGS
jgi:hypothetical protein